MDSVRKFLSTATLPVKAFMAISVISAAVVLNRSVISPYFKRQRYKQAEEWANKIYEQEERVKEGGGSTTNNILY